MNRTKKLRMLILVLAAVSAVTFGVLKYEEHKEQIAETDEIIMELDTAAVTVLSWECNGESFSFYKDGQWMYEGDENFPVDEDEIESMLSMFESFGAAFIIEDPESESDYGLDDPVCAITIETEDQTYEITAGDYSAMDEERYVSIGDGNVYLVTDDPVLRFDTALSDLIRNDEVPDLEETTEIAFSGGENYEIFRDDSGENSKNDSEEEKEDVYFTDVGGERTDLDSDYVENYIQTIAGLDLTDYVTYTADSEDLSAYGLDDPELIVTLRYAEETDDEETFMLSVSRDPKEKEKAEKEKKKDEEDTDDEEEITAYLRVGESRLIYRISESEYNSLMDAAFDSFRYKEVFRADPDDIETIQITLDNEEYTITSKEKNDTRTYSYNGEEADLSAFKSDLTSLKAQSFTSEEPKQKEEIRLDITVGGEDKEEISIVFYRYDGNRCLAVIDGEPISLVNRADVVDLIEAVNTIIL